MRLELRATAALLLAGTLAGCAGLGIETSKNVELSQIAINKNEALRQTNAWRATHSLPPIKLDPHLSEVSQDMADHIARLDSLKTRRHSSSSLISRTQTNGYKSFAGAENLGAGYANISAAMTGWKTSPDHNKNLLNKNVTHMGIARTNRADGTYRNFWVMTLAAPQKPVTATGFTTVSLPFPIQ
ncbi:MULTISPECIES: CAP domain-containing protein [unclassified Pseudovibrio]|uniref:CAP domain-containing protein n=1 Tax=unclassified Pseudovibrio TaxID=2627060 RepID=UPI0007B1F5DF|nr:MULTISPECIES: CAP domain-containing protein [unclassified Pseudovibrio]KZL02852.1 Cysteine-rich secretory protein family protein [Pseudovibrio sp. W74]KZL07555.1 Cysteine-rich secretory protein family protein [Pseudovibrio sp. Ad14]